MSGLIDFETQTALADWPLEEETGVTSTAWSPGFVCNDAGIALGIADADIIAKES